MTPEADVQRMLDLVERGRDDPIARLMEALADPDYLFTRAQVAFLMATAARWAREDRDREPGPETYEAGRRDGYRQRVAEENAAYPPPPIAGWDGVLKMIDQVDYRRRCDAEARRRRPGDYRGGPVPVWDADRPDVEPPPGRLMIDPDSEGGVRWVRG